MAVKILNDTVDEENGFLKQVYDDRTGKNAGSTTSSYLMIGKKWLLFTEMIFR